MKRLHSTWNTLRQIMIFLSLRTLISPSTWNSNPLRENDLRSALYVITLYVEWISKKPLLMVIVLVVCVWPCVCVWVMCTHTNECPKIKDTLIGILSLFYTTVILIKHL